METDYRFPMTGAAIARRTGVHISCPKCGGRNVLFRKRDGVLWCRRCGHEWNKNATPAPAKREGN